MTIGEHPEPDEPTFVCEKLKLTICIGSPMKDKSPVCFGSPGIRGRGGERKKQRTRTRPRLDRVTVHRLEVGPRSSIMFKFGLSTLPSGRISCKILPGSYAPFKTARFFPFIQFIQGRREPPESLICEPQETYRTVGTESVGEATDVSI